MKKGLADALLDIVYPRRCAICDSVLKLGNDEGICKKCKQKVEYVTEPFCKKCGKPLADDTEEYCGDCQKKVTSYRYGRAAFVYNKYMRKSIARFKYHDRMEYAGYYAKEIYRVMGEDIISLGAELLVPVPIHKSRYKKRGYNQAYLIAKHLGELMNIPVADDYISRIKHTAPQKELSASERKTNVSDAFVITEKSKELYRNINCVIIIDDIYTTGSTIEACSRTLICAGVKAIYYVCICIGKGI